MKTEITDRYPSRHRRPFGFYPGWRPGSLLVGSISQLFGIRFCGIGLFVIQPFVIQLFAIRLFAIQLFAIQLFVILLLVTQFLVMGAPSSASASPSEPSHREIIVKYRSAGPHALEDCAERISAAGLPFGGHSADGSDSLDRILRRHRVGRQKALFRRPTSASLVEQRARMQARWARSLIEHPRGRAAQSPRGPKFPDLAHIYRIEIPAGVNAENLIEELRADAHVEYAQPDHGMELDQNGLVPNDPYFHSSGSWGQSFADLWGPDRIRAPEAWLRSQGEGSVVAVVDTGLDGEHPDIVENL